MTDRPPESNAELGDLVRQFYTAQMDGMAGMAKINDERYDALSQRVALIEKLILDIAEAVRSARGEVPPKSSDNGGGDAVHPTAH
jgi:hypothetical protein